MNKCKQLIRCSIDFSNIIWHYNFDHNPIHFQTLVVLIDEEGTVIKEVKVLDVDTISQAKEKILDAIHRNKPYSSRPSANQVSLGTSTNLLFCNCVFFPTFVLKRKEKIICYYTHYIHIEMTFLPWF